MWLKNLFFGRNEKASFLSSQSQCCSNNVNHVQQILCNPTKYNRLSFEEQVQMVYSSPLVKLGILDENWKIPSFSENSLAEFSIENGQEKEEYINPFPLSLSDKVLFEERIWGIKVCDYFLYDTNDFSLATAMQRALLLPNAEVVSLKKINYLEDGTRCIIDASEPLCFVIHKKPAEFVKKVNRHRAKDLFPECADEIEKLGSYITWLDVSEDSYRLLVTERPVSFHVYTIENMNDKLKMQNICFKNIFAGIASAVKLGNLSPVDTENFVCYTYDESGKIKEDTYNFKVGFCNLNFEQAQKIAKDKKSLRLTYIDGKYKFDYHSNGFALMRKENQIVVPMEIYDSWGAEFTEDELDCIFAKIGVSE